MQYRTKFVFLLILLFTIEGSVGNEIKMEAAAQAVDAVGVLALMCAQYERQLAEIDGTEFFADFVQLDAKRPIEKALVKKQEQLRAAFVVAGEWGLVPLDDTLSADAIVAAAAPVEAMGGLPIAVPVDPSTGKPRPTMQTVLGRMALEGGGEVQQYTVRCVEAKVKGRYTMGPNPHAGKSRKVARDGMVATEILKSSPRLDTYDRKRADITAEGKISSSSFPPPILFIVFFLRRQENASLLCLCLSPSLSLSLFPSW